MVFVKGVSGNPSGKKKGAKTPYVMLLEAVRRVEKEKGIKLFTHFVERAFEKDKVLIALLKKLIADKKEISGDVNNPLNIIMLPAVDFPPEASPEQGANGSTDR